MSARASCICTSTYAMIEFGTNCWEPTGQSRLARGNEPRFAVAVFLTAQPARAGGIERRISLERVSTFRGSGWNDRRASDGPPIHGRIVLDDLCLWSAELGLLLV